MKWSNWEQLFIQNDEKRERREGGKNKLEERREKNIEGFCERESETKKGEKVRVWGREREREREWKRGRERERERESEREREK